MDTKFSHARLLSLCPEPSLSFPFSPAATPHQQPAPTTASASKLQPPASAVAAAATASRQQRLQRQQVSMEICLQRPTQTATAAAGQHATQARGTAPLAARTDACTQTTTSQATQTEPEAPTPSRSFWTQTQATSAWNTDLQRQVWSANHRAELAKRSADLKMEEFKKTKSIHSKISWTQHKTSSSTGKTHSNRFSSDTRQVCETSQSSESSSGSGSSRSSSCCSSSSSHCYSHPLPKHHRRRRRMWSAAAHGPRNLRRQSGPEGPLQAVSIHESSGSSRELCRSHRKKE